MSRIHFLNGCQKDNVGSEMLREGSGLFTEIR
jgi:hypothetical protein